MDRGTKEEYLQYFNNETLKKGDCAIKAGGKIEEMYIIESGKIVLC